MSKSEADPEIHQKCLNRRSTAALTMEANLEVYETQIEELGQLGAVSVKLGLQNYPKMWFEWFEWS